MRARPRNAVHWLVLICLSGVAAHAAAEQKQTFGAYEVHYIVLPTMDLNASVANKYDLPRAKDRALVNISVLDEQGEAVRVNVDGRSENLLGQRQRLQFNEVVEGPATYYLSVLRHADEEFHRVSIDIELPDGKTAELKFQQQMFWQR